MTNQSQVVALHRKHPKWSASDIAKRLGCLPAYVRATGKRRGLNFAKAKVEREAVPESIVQLGRAARDAGLSVSDIESMASRLAAAERVARRVSNLERPLVGGHE
jgi:hypothetical protein